MDSTTAPNQQGATNAATATPAAGTQRVFPLLQTVERETSLPGRGFGRHPGTYVLSGMEAELIVEPLAASLRQVESVCDGCGELPPRDFFGVNLLAPGARQRVVFGLAMVIAIRPRRYRAAMQRLKRRRLQNRDSKCSLGQFQASAFPFRFDKE